ncbi:MAG: hypothetical protein B6D39_03650 [Anaerolineae bacterium UTCFX2]|jgi:NAD(P)-dependent dehydrogenase (short-subunit alcohol dehydrogenase family)|nr:SDR family NAD(P)-dependent oxidoreductase [Anaerolineales bacterium]OQY92989.1 MAG: hypothetical protein B6D39_03650 [Anaerolineae bacterium UTCFX2]
MEEQAQFSGQVVLIAGAGRALGRRLAREFARSGALLALNDVTPVNLDLTLQSILDEGGQARDYVADVSKRMPALNMIDQVLEDFERVDVLVNHTCVSPPAALLELDEWDWQRALEVNLSGAFFLTQLLGRQMRHQGGGAILHLASPPRLPDPKRQAAYLTGMHGLVGLTRAAAQELAEYGVRVNAVCPWDSPAENLSLADQAEPDPRLVELILALCSRGSTLTGAIVRQPLDLETRA